MTTAYIIAKRYAGGDLIAYLRHDKSTGMGVFDTRDPQAAVFLTDLPDAMQHASDWQDYWASKGFPGYRATVEEINEHTETTE